MFTSDAREISCVIILKSRSYSHAYTSDTSFDHENAALYDGARP